MSVDYAALCHYPNGRQYLVDEFRLLDLRFSKILQNAKTRSRLDGLVITEAHINGLLNRPSALDHRDEADAQALAFDCRIIAAARAAALAGIFLPLPELAVRFGLSRLDQRILVLCLAPELDRKYDKLCGYLHDDVTARRPTVGLALELLCDTPSAKLDARAVFAADAPLVRNGLIELGERGDPLIARPLKLDERIVDYLLQVPSSDPRVASLRSFDETGVSAEIVGRIRSFFERHAPPGSPENCPALFYLRAQAEADARHLAEAISTELEVTLLSVDAQALVARPEAFEREVRLLVRDAILTDAAICFAHGDALFRNAGPELRCVMEATAGRLTFFTGEAPWHVPGLLGGRMLAEIELPMPGLSHRERAWAQRLNGAALHDGIDVAALAAQFRFTPRQIDLAVGEAESRASWDCPQARIDMAFLQQVCRTQSTPHLDSLARLITPRRALADLVLPQDEVRQLREFCEHARYRDQVYGEWGFDQKLATGKGLNALFCGAPGAGKTLAAEASANALGRDLYKIDLSQVVSKYVGDTEKLLRRIFDEAQGSNAILFFDEADTLFGKRSEVKDAHDRYGNIQVGYLLQRMEEYDGISIMATNLRKNLDEAFVRRLQFIIEFPFPEERERAQIWRTHLPPQMPLADDLDVAFLSAAFKLSGGYIRNIVVAAAFQAAAEGSALAMRHVVRAVRREYQKMGRVCTQAEFGKFGPLLLEDAA